MKSISRLLKATFFAMCTLMLFMGNAKASADPVALLDNVTHRVMEYLDKNRAEMRQNPGHVYSVVNRLILPYVDFNEMARWVVGRNAWREADESVRKEFVREFENLVVRTYAQSLLSYDEQKLEFLPLRESYQGKERVRVSSILHDGRRGTMHLDYHLIRSGNSWKVYDIVIEGVSLMQGYRAQFSESVRRGGIEAVIMKIRRHHSRDRQ